MERSKARKRRRLKRRIKKLKLPAKIFKIMLFTLSLVLVIGLGVLSVRTFGMKIVVDGNAMEPTLKDNEIVKINKFSYILSSPKRFDIVVFRVGKSGGGRNYIRRIIGLPNETVRISEGTIYINNEPLNITFNDEYLINGGMAEDGVTLGMDEYFVLGDNYNECEDSRLSNIGNVEEEQIIGKIK